MSATVLGAIDWELERESEGHRTYHITWRVLCSDVGDGPLTVSEAEGLPAVGSSWNFENDSDIWAYCWPDLTVSKYGPAEEAGTLWTVKQKFSTKSLGEQTEFSNPLDTPPKTSGTFSKMTKRVDIDKDGNLVKSSSHEFYPNIEIDESRPTVCIELTLASLPLTTYSAMVDDVNDASIWGLPARTVKLSNISWERHAHQSLLFFYTVNFQFEVCYNTFDYKVFDHGTRVYKGVGSLTNPQSYKAAIDDDGNPKIAYLNGSGVEITNISSLVLQTFKFYGESNFLLLGIPASL